MPGAILADSRLCLALRVDCRNSGRWWKVVGGARAVAQVYAVSCYEWEKK